MPLLGMLAAGAATGLRDASNMNVRAQNELELDQSREMLREQFYNRRYNQSRADAKEDAKNTALMNEVNFERSRKAKLEDREIDRKHKLEIEGIKESGRNSRNSARIAASRENALLRDRGGEGSDGFGKMSSPAGKAATDLMRLGLAEDPATAYQMAVRLDIVKAAQQNPMTKIDDNALLGSVQRLTQGLFPGNTGAPQNQASGDPVRTFNPKTRKFE